MFGGGGGIHGFIVPKSFLYASTWRIPRGRLLDGLEILVDCGRAWDEVLLEQVIYLHRSGAKTPAYRNLKREEQQFETVNTIDKREYQRFEIYVNGVDDSELQIAHQMVKGGEFFGNHIVTTSGADLQNKVSGIKNDFTVLGGVNVQRYYLRGIKGYCNLNVVRDRAVIKAGNLLVQDILAFIGRPMEHVKITAHLVQEDENDFLILNTINQIEIISDELSPYFVLALLNSKLINWYVYRFIYAKPIRTMHFNRPVIQRIPLPNYAAYPDLISSIVAEVKKIYMNRRANEKLSQSRIDKYIFQLYGLSPQQTALVEENMP